MGKRILILTLTVLMLISSFTVTALADGYCNLGSVYTGAVLNYRIADITDGYSVGCDNLPAGLQLAAFGGGIYLSGIAQNAGDYTFVIYTDDPMTGCITCNLYVTPAAPQITASADVDCNVGDYALLSVSAFSGDGGAVNYQWYAGASPEGIGGYPVAGANGPEISPPTSTEGTTYYYCVVSNAQGETAASRAIRVTVKAMQPESIMVHTLPKTVEYRMGQLIKVDGLTLEVRYANGRSDIVSDGFTVYPGSYDAVNNVLILNVEYQGRQCSFPVNVTESEPVISGIGMVKLPDKQEFSEGEFFDGTGLVFRVYYADGTYSDENSGYTVEPTVVSGSSTQTMTLYYKDFSCTFPITVKSNAAPASMLEVASTPAKLTYTVGDSLDTSGLVLRDTQNGVQTVVRDGYSVSPTVLNTAGVQTVTVTYNGKSTYFTVEVKEAADGKTALPGVKDKLDSAMEKINIKPTGEANKGAIVVVLIVALLALGALGAYMVVLENGGPEEIKYRIEVFIYNIRAKFKKK